MPNFEAESVDDIYAKVGEGLVTGWDVLKAVYNKVFTEGISPRCTHSKVGGEVILQ